MLDRLQRSLPITLELLTLCQSKKFDSSKDGYGFYMVHYQNDKSESIAEANEIKKFITQFGSISTGYPWYMAYCKYPDGKIYARYGSLYSVNYDIKTDEYDVLNEIEKEFFNKAVATCGKEIAYSYNEDGNDDDGDSDGNEWNGDSDGQYRGDESGAKSAKEIFRNLGHDCVIITKDNKIVRYSERTGTFIIEGDYNPTKNIKTAKIK